MDRTTWKTWSISHPRYKAKVYKQQLTNQHSAFSTTCCTDRVGGCYSDLGCATHQQPMRDVQQKSRSKIAQQKSTCVIRVMDYDSDRVFCAVFLVLCRYIFCLWLPVVDSAGYPSATLSAHKALRIVSYHMAQRCDVKKAITGETLYETLSPWTGGW